MSLKQGQMSSIDLKNRASISTFAYPNMKGAYYRQNHIVTATLWDTHSLLLENVSLPDNSTNNTVTAEIILSNPSC